MKRDRDFWTEELWEEHQRQRRRERAAKAHGTTEGRHRNAALGSAERSTYFLVKGEAAKCAAAVAAVKAMMADRRARGVSDLPLA